MTSFSIFLLRVSAILYASSLVYGSCFYPFENTFENGYYYDGADIAEDFPESSMTHLNESTRSSSLITLSSNAESCHLKEYHSLEAVFQANDEYFLLDLDITTRIFFDEQKALRNYVPKSQVPVSKSNGQQVIKAKMFYHEYIVIGNEVVLRSSVDKSDNKIPIDESDSQTLVDKSDILPPLIKVTRSGWITSIASSLSPKSIAKFMCPTNIFDSECEDSVDGKDDNALVESASKNKMVRAHDENNDEKNDENYEGYCNFRNLDIFHKDY